MQKPHSSEGVMVQVFPGPAEAVVRPAEHIEREFDGYDQADLIRQVEAWIYSKGHCGELMIRLSVQEELFGHDIAVLADKMAPRLRKPRYKVMVSCGQHD